MSTLMHLNYLHVLVAAVIGFLVGWLWYSVLFGKAWMAEMKVTEEQMNANKGTMGPKMVKTFVYLFISTAGLAMVLRLASIGDWAQGAKVGAAVGLLIVGARLGGGGVWECKSCKLICINIFYEVVIFAIQGAILTAWA